MSVLGPTREAGATEGAEAGAWGPPDLTAGILRPHRSEMQLLPPSPLKTPESENNEPCHHPGNSIWPGNSTRGKRKGWGPYSFSACSNRKERKVWGQGKQVQGHPVTSKSAAKPCTPPDESFCGLMVSAHECEESMVQDHPRGRRESKVCPASSAKPGRQGSHYLTGPVPGLPPRIVFHT